MFQNSKRQNSTWHFLLENQSQTYLDFIPTFEIFMSEVASVMLRKLQVFKRFYVYLSINCDIKLSGNPLFQESSYLRGEFGLG